MSEDHSFIFRNVQSESGKIFVQNKVGGKCLNDVLPFGLIFENPQAFRITTSFFKSKPFRNVQKCSTLSNCESYCEFFGVYIPMGFQDSLAMYTSPLANSFHISNLRDGFGFLCTSLLALIPLGIHIGTLLLHFLHKPCPVLTRKKYEKKCRHWINPSPNMLFSLFHSQMDEYNPIKPSTQHPKGITHSHSTELVFPGTKNPFSY